MERNVFIYWTGKEPSLILLLRDIMRKHSNEGKNYNLIHINDDNLTDFIEVPTYFEKLLPAHKADYIRVQVLHNRGGIWLDSDTLVMSDLSSLFKIIEKHNGFFILENNQILWNGVFGTKSKTPLMVEWKKRMENTFAKKEEKILWAEVGCLMLDKMARETKLFNNYVVFKGLDTVYPVNWNHCVNEFVTKPYENYLSLRRTFQPFVVLVNSVYKKLSDKTQEEILNGDMPLSYFLKTSLEKTEKK